MRIGIDARLASETGVGRYIRNLISNLAETDKKNSYTIFASPHMPTQLRVRANNFRYITAPIPWHTIAEQIKLPKLIEQEKLDLVHFPYFSVPILYKRPYVITIHDLIIHHFPTGKASTLPLPLYYVKHRAYQAIIKKAAHEAHKILTVSHATKDEIVKLLGVPEEKIVVTYEGVDENIVAKESAMVSFKNYFLYVGNAYPHKNLERLIAAFALVHKEYPKVQLLLVGKKNYFYERLALEVKKQNLTESIHFLGEIDDSSLIALYKHALALVTPSLMEGFGLPGLEAMAQRCLVLASDIPVYREIYKDACLYFNPASISEIHATILRVLEKRADFAALKAKGTSRLHNFSWKNLAQETQAVYESSIGIRQGK